MKINDIQVNPKMIMTLIAALVHIGEHGQQEEMIDFTSKDFQK